MPNKKQAFFHEKVYSVCLQSATVGGDIRPSRASKRGEPGLALEGNTITARGTAPTQKAYRQEAMEKSPAQVHLVLRLGICTDGHSPLRTCTCTPFPVAIAYLFASARVFTLASRASVSV